MAGRGEGKRTGADGARDERAADAARGERGRNLDRVPLLAGEGIDDLLLAALSVVVRRGGRGGARGKKRGRGRQRKGRSGVDRWAACSSRAARGRLRVRSAACAGRRTFFPPPLLSFLFLPTAMLCLPSSAVGGGARKRHTVEDGGPGEGQGKGARSACVGGSGGGGGAEAAGRRWDGAQCSTRSEARTRAGWARHDGHG